MIGDDHDISMTLWNKIVFSRFISNTLDAGLPIELQAGDTHQELDACYCNSIYVSISYFLQQEKYAYTSYQ